MTDSKKYFRKIFEILIFFQGIVVMAVLGPLRGEWTAATPNSQDLGMENLERF